MTNTAPVGAIQGWVVSATLAGPAGADHDTLSVALLDAMPTYGLPAGHVTGEPGRIGTMVTVDHVYWDEAARRVTDAMISHLGAEWQVVEVRVQTEAEQDRELAMPAYPAMVGSSEAAEILGVSKQRVSQLYAEGRLPTPVVVLASGPVFLESAVRAFAAQPRRGGRPPGIRPRDPSRLPRRVAFVNAKGEVTELRDLLATEPIIDVLRQITVTVFQVSDVHTKGLTDSLSHGPGRLIIEWNDQRFDEVVRLTGVTSSPEAPRVELQFTPEAGQSAPVAG